MSAKQKNTFADQKIFYRAINDSFIKLSPKTQAENPVMFLVFVSAILTSVLWVVSLFGIKDAPGGFTLAIAIILWFTVLFANFAEAIAEGRGKAQADSLRASRKDVDAHKIPSAEQKDNITVVPSAMLKKGELVIVKAGEQIPADGEVIEGAASVDESAITGESAPVIREAGGDRSAVTGGTTVLSDWIVVKVTSEAGESFLDKMIAMVEGAARKKTPNEIALQIFLVALSIIFILVTVSLYTYSIFSAKLAGIENPTSVTTLVALLVCLAPTTIGALLSAIGIAGTENKLDVGFAFDGDADRCIAVDETGRVIDGDLILYIYGKYMKDREKLANNTVVTTVMSNFGLYRAFDRAGINYEKTDVGDKYVYECMRKNGHLLGGEQSGHIIFSKYAATGDGLLTAIKLMQAMLANKQPLSVLAAPVKIYPQLLVNVRVSDKEAVLNNDVVKGSVREAEEALGDNGRVLLRKSGTEPVIRVMAEAQTTEECRRVVDGIVDAIKREGLAQQK